MGSAIRTLTEVQFGKESPAGTAVAASWKLMLRNATYRRQEEFEEYDDQMHGLVTGPTTAPVLVRNHTELRLECPFDFHQVMLPLLSGVKGGVSAVQIGSGQARAWTFEPGVAADPALDPYTYEFVERSFADRAQMEAPYGLTSGFEITGGLESLPTLAWDVFARKTADSTYTSGLSSLGLFAAPSARWGIYIDETWAGRGGTQISGQIYDFNMRYDSGVRPGFYQDNRTDLDFTQPEYGERRLDLTLNTVHDPAAAKLIQTEEAKKTAGTLRFVRLALTGQAFAAPDAALNYLFQTDVAMYHAPDSMVERGGQRDSNAIAPVHLRSAYDPTGAIDLSIAVINSLTQFP